MPDPHAAAMTIQQKQFSGQPGLDEPRRQALDAEYDAIFEAGDSGGAGSKFLKLSGRYKNVWPKNLLRLGMFSTPFDGRVFLDFGCKFGHSTPLLKLLGVARVISVDVDEEYLRDGERFIGARHDSTYVRSDDCLIDVESGSVDLVYANEVISHINPRDLETFYSEVSRVLKPGGELVICDENNLADESKRRELIAMSEQWDRGSSKELGSNYEAQRRRLIAKAFPELGEDRVEYFARCTAGLDRERLLDSVRKAIETGQFVERRYRPGSVAINPNHGTAMERGFYPIQVILSLAANGMSALQVLDEDGNAPVPSEAVDGCGNPFVIRAIKLPEDQQELIRHRPL